MNRGQTVFAQLLQFISHNDFYRFVHRYGGDRRIRTLSCWEQFLALAFAQLTRRESLRDIEVSLAAHREQLYHAGFRSPVKRSTLADANETRDWRIYSDLAQHLIQQARPLYRDVDLGLDLDGTLYALDSSIIDLSLTLFPWAPHERSRAAVKLHTLLDVQSFIPVFIDITGAHTSDSHVLDRIIPEPGSFIVMDRGYVDFMRCTRCIRPVLSSSLVPSKAWMPGACIRIPWTGTAESSAISASCSTVAARVENIQSTCAAFASAILTRAKLWSS